jgi:hypothetical protein
VPSITGGCHVDAELPVTGRLFGSRIRAAGSVGADDVPVPPS